MLENVRNSARINRDTRKKINKLRNERYHTLRKLGLDSIESMIGATLCEVKYNELLQELDKKD